MLRKYVPPSDINTPPRFRLPLPDRGDLDPEGKSVYDALADPNGRYLAGLKGPGGVRLHSPPLSVAMQRVGDYLRFESGITPQVREVAILTTARETDSRFEWAAHEPEAVRVGVDLAVIEAIKHRRSTDGLPETDAVVIAVGREAIGMRRVSLETFSRALQIFGPRGLVELVSLMGQYTATAVLIAVFDYQPDPDKPALPLP